MPTKLEAKTNELCEAILEHFQLLGIQSNNHQSRFLLWQQAELSHDGDPLRMSSRTLCALIGRIGSLLFKVAGNNAELVKVGYRHRQVGGSIAPTQRIEPEQDCIKTFAVENLRTSQTVEET
jgi:hypothetical protein